MAKWQEEVAAEQTTSRPTKGRPKSPQDSSYELDPDGDITLILNSDPRSGHVNDITSVHLNSESEESNLGSERSLELFARGDVVELVDEETVPTDPPVDGESVSTDVPADGPDPIDLPVDGLIAEGGTPAAQADEENPSQEFRIRASSKHLILASPVFKRMLQVSFREGHQLSSQGHAELYLPDDNPAALLILLNLIHGRTREVPRTIKLWTFIEVATIVDKYELLETTELVTEHWFRGLEGDIPSSFTKRLLPWMCLSWVFKKPEIFRKTTQIAILESEGLLEVDYLPIPQSVLEKINTCRQDTLFEIFDYLQDTLEKYQGSERICPEGIRCDGMLLGSLTIGLKAINILQPTPQPPYDGFSVKGLCQSLAEIEVPQYCDSDFGYRSYSRGQTCKGVKRPLEAKIEELQQQLQGLDLTGEIQSS